MNTVFKLLTAWAGSVALLLVVTLAAWLLGSFAALEFLPAPDLEYVRLMGALSVLLAWRYYTSRTHRYGSVLDASH